ncbi:MAG: phosphatase PAP2 family protein [Deltaproteobacteria bacterium]|nr:phosphatase PAP2 family protein [Deltaproteobacteria bacterium]
MLCIFAALLTSACGTLPNGRRWGQDATLCPGWPRVGKAAVNAALSPATWVPAAGAAIMQIDDWDGKVSRWASRETPVFGSRGNADTAADVLKHTCEAAYVITLLATPSGEMSGDWLKAKVKGALPGVAALGLVEGVTYGLQQATHHKRPDKDNYESFPSTHATTAAAASALASRNLTYISMPGEARFASRAGLVLLSVGTAWARVEAQKHFPADVLAGMALGNFIGIFMNDAFLGIDPNTFHVALAPTRQGGYVSLTWTY